MRKAIPPGVTNIPDARLPPQGMNTSSSFRENFPRAVIESVLSQEFPSSQENQEGWPSYVPVTCHQQVTWSLQLSTQWQTDGQGHVDGP